ncbi:MULTISPECIES: hypothetical protein [unclassified Paenibacillus]|nr:MULTISPECIES: hypothetical protein [unclassified Paenibacillus]MBP1156817.1 hypothetical protein [Paenibacillus sp. PvP091]MBP1172444.1 hypothetical protein [Paenibacillus sp. PvR098]
MEAGALFDLKEERPVKYLWGTLLALALVFLGAGVYYFINNA